MLAASASCCCFLLSSATLACVRRRRGVRAEDTFALATCRKSGANLLVHMIQEAIDEHLQPWRLNEKHASAVMHRRTSISSSFCSVIDLSGKILGLHSTSAS